MSVITIVGNNESQHRRGKAHNFISRETFTGSTTSATQFNLNNSAEQHALGAGTATGIFLNSYRLSTNALPRAVEGQFADVLLIATGEAYLNYNNSTATGAWVFNATDSYMKFQFLSGKWRVLVNSGCTLATTTY